MAMYENSMALDAEIERLTSLLGKLDPVTGDYEAVRKNLDTLYKLREAQYETDTTSNTAAEKLEAEKEDQAAKLELEQEKLELEKRKLEFAERQHDANVEREKAEQKQKAAETELEREKLELASTQHTDLIADKKKDRVRDYVTTGVQLAVSALKLAAVIGVSLIMTDQGYKFEENGVPTSPTFREARKNIADLIKDTFKK